MSNLGKIYIINIDKGRKDILPVIYMNSEYIYCKVYGTHQLTEFRVPRVYEYESFKAKYDCGDLSHSMDHVVYVPAHVKTYFEWIKIRTPLEKKIDELKEEIQTYDEKIEYHSNRIKDNEDLIARTTKYKEQAMQELEKLQEELQKSLSKRNPGVYCEL